MLNYRHYQQAHLGYGISRERKISQQRTLALLRFLVVSVILLCYFVLDRDLNREVLIVLILSLLLSAFIYFNKRIYVWLASHRYIEFLIDEILIFTACFYSGGLHSPYILTLFLPLLVHAVSPMSKQLVMVVLVTISNLILIGLTTVMYWQLVAHFTACLLLGAVFINILVFNDVRVWSTYAIHDGLTGLYSHQYFWDQLRSMMQPGNAIKTFSLIMIDLDEFKRLNDEHGHLEGDRVLKEIAYTIKSNVRDSDTVARYGGDEFAIILPGIGYKMCRSIVERLSTSIVNLGYFDHVSIGAALYPDEADTAEGLVNLADTRMYRQKRDNKKQSI